MESTGMLTPLSTLPLAVLPVPPGVVVEARSTDLGLRAEVEGLGRLLLQGSARGSSVIGARLELTVDGEELAVPLQRGMTARDTFLALQRALPSGYLATARAAAEGPSGAWIVGLCRGQPPVASRPQVQVSIEDPVQHSRKLDGHRFEIAGIASNGGTVQSSVVAEIDGKRILLMLGRGTVPLATARALEARLPRGYEMIIEASRDRTGPVVVTILHDAGIRAAAA